MPVVEDWHARLTLVKVCTYTLHSCLFNISSIPTILGYLVIAFFKQIISSKRHIISVEGSTQQNSSAHSSGKNVKATEDFLTVILHAYIITAAKNILSKKTIKSVAELSKEIVETYLNIIIPIKPFTSTVSETNGVCKDKMFCMQGKYYPYVCMIP